MNLAIDTERDLRLREGLRSAGLSALLAWRTEEIVLCTGSTSHLGMTLCLYPLQGAPYIYLPIAEPVDGAPDAFVRRRYNGEWEDLRAQLAADIAQLGGPEKSLGLSEPSPQQVLPGNSAETPRLTDAVIAALLTGYPIGDASELFSNAIQYKTTRDITALRRANTIAGIGLQAFADSLRVGVTEAELAGIVEATIQAQTGRLGCASARAWAFIQAGPHSAFAGTYSRSSGYAITAGDLVVIELGTCVDGYWSDLTRTCTIGAPTPAQQALLRAVSDAQSAAIAAVHPGVSHQDVDRAARAVLVTHGFGEGFTHATGHHVGFRYHDPGPMLAPTSATPLAAGMVITIEPGTYHATYGGARIEDNVLVRAEGAELLSPQQVAHWEA